MKKVHAPYICFFILLSACNWAFRNKQKVCNLNKIATIYADVYTRGGQDPVYAHYVLFDGFDKNCQLDSTEVLKIVNHYIDTVFVKTKPVVRISLFSSIDRFIPGETSQVWEETNKDCIVDIAFDRETKKPTIFTFYKKDGKIESRGRFWKKSK